MALPSNVTFGTVTGTFLQAVADTPQSPGRAPDGQPVTDLVVKFTASISPAVVRDMSSTPPTMIVVQPITASVDATGTLIGPDGTPGVTLLATTDTALDPHGWVWTVSLSSATFPAVSFSFSLDSGATVDLATVLQVPITPGATLAQWLQAVTDAQAARDAAQAAAASVPSAASLAATYVALPPLGTAAGDVPILQGDGSVSWGPPSGGGTGNDPAFQFTQASPLAQWTIGHAFGRRPDVDVYLTTGEHVITDVTASPTQVVITFPTPTAGYAVLT